VLFDCHDVGDAMQLVFVTVPAWLRVASRRDGTERTI